MLFACWVFNVIWKILIIAHYFNAIFPSLCIEQPQILILIVTGHDCSWISELWTGVTKEFV